MLNTAAVVPAVIEAIKAESGRPVGNHRIPGADTEVPEPPWAVVYEIPNEEVRPTSYTEDTYDMVWLEIQVTATAEISQQAAWMADQAREAILGRSGGGWKQPITIPDGLVIGRTWAMTNRIDDHYQGVWECHARYKLLVSGV